MINGQPIRGEDGAALQKFSILLTRCSNTLREIGSLNRLENPDSLRKIVDQLPYPLRLKWCDLVDSINQKEGRDPNLKDITDFVEAKSRVTNHPILGKISGEQRFINLSDKIKQRKSAKTFTQSKDNPSDRTLPQKRRRKLSVPHAIEVTGFRSAKTSRNYA